MKTLVTNVVKSCFKALGLTVSRRDPLAELIPTNYHSSAFLPRLYRQTAGRLFYFQEMLERVRAAQGDVVECGVSIGHGILSFMMLGEMMGRDRRVWGFDSFEGFPVCTEADRKSDGTHQVRHGYYATPLRMVTQVLEDGRVSPSLIEKNLRTVKGYFDRTLGQYEGRIAVLHLDCDLYESYRTCLAALYEKVVPGGVIMFDEYEDDSFPGARRAVDEFFADKPERPAEYNRYLYRKYYVVKQQRAAPAAAPCGQTGNGA
jgi:hypothetical protein